MTTAPAPPALAGTRVVTRLTLIAVAAAVVVNVIIYFVSKAVGADFLVDDGAGGRIEVPAVVIAVATAVPMLIGALAAIVAVPRWSRARPALIVIGAVLAVITIPPALMADASTGTRVTLSILHLVCGAAYVAALVKAGDPDLA